MLGSAAHMSTRANEWGGFIRLPRKPPFGSPGDVTVAGNSGHCLSTAMRLHPLTLPTVTPLTGLLVAVQSQQCDSAE